MARRWLNIHAAGRTAMHMMPAALVAVAADHFTGFDWAVVALYFAATTLVGARLAGRQATIRDFFLGGRKLPWYAVSGSIIATEISAVTFVGVPATVYFGDWRYLQLGLGAILARVIVGYWFVPAFYEREIYSPYDYMAHRLGPRVKLLTTGLFVVGQVLAQGVRVYLTALVLEVVTDGQLGLSASIWTLGVVAVGWTLLGGIATVIWTDVLLFLAFVAGGVIALGYVSHLLPGGFGELLRVGWGAGKFRVLDLSSDPTSDFTLWAGLIACTVFNLSMFGTDQLIAQRMFCCRDARAARRAMISSSVGLLVTVTMMLVGVGLFAFYSRHPLAPADAAAVAERSDRLFPIFIIRVLPVGLTGLVTTGIFAAAISSLDSILAALSQTTMSVTYQPLLRWRLPRTRREPAARSAGVARAGGALGCGPVRDGPPEQRGFAVLPGHSAAGVVDGGVHGRRATGRLYVGVPADSERRPRVVVVRSDIGADRVRSGLASAVGPLGLLDRGGPGADGLGCLCRSRGQPRRRLADHRLGGSVGGVDVDQLLRLLAWGTGCDGRRGLPDGGVALVRADRLWSGVRFRLGAGEKEKGVRMILPERPEGCCAQNHPDTFFPVKHRAN